MAIYWQYFRSGGGTFSFICLAFSFLITQFFFSASDYWLNIWTNAEEARYSENITTTTTEPDEFAEFLMANLTSVDGNSTSNWLSSPDTNTGIYVFTILIVGLFVFSLIRSVHFFIMCMVSSVNLHNKMFECVIRAPLRFFDCNPVGNYSIASEIMQRILFIFFNCRENSKSIRQRYWLHGRNVTSGLL